MAYAVQLTISSTSKVSLGPQSQEVGVSLTYELEREDTDLMQVVEQKAAEVARAHNKTWRRIRDERKREVQDGKSSAPTAESEPSPSGSSPEAEEAPSPPSTSVQQNAIRRLLGQTGMSNEQVAEAAQVRFTSDDLASLTVAQAARVLLALQRHEREKAQAARAA